MRYIISLLVFTSLFSGLAFATGYKPEETTLIARICIERPENTGPLNVVSTEVKFSNGQKLSLSGGQAACIQVKPGEYSFEIESMDPNPASHEGKPRTWESKTINVSVKEDEIATYEIFPETDENGYIGGWTAKRILNER